MAKLILSSQGKGRALEYLQDRIKTVSVVSNLTRPETTAAYTHAGEWVSGANATFRNVRITVSTTPRKLTIYNFLTREDALAYVVGTGVATKLLMFGTTSITDVSMPFVREQTSENELILLGDMTITLKGDGE